MPSDSNHRREFLRHAAQGLMALAAASGWPASLGANPLDLPIGIQMGWVGDDCEKDLEGTLKNLADIGYGEVEAFSPFFNRPPREFRRVLDAHGLKCPSAHWIPAASKPEWDKQVEAAKQIGLRYLTVPWLQAVADAKSLDDCKRNAETFNKMGEQCHKAGLQLAVHNHYAEFRKFNGVIAYDVLVQETDSKLVTFELDCFWCAFAGRDPAEYLERYPSRFALLHIKDLKPGFEPSTEKVEGQPFTEVGQGVIKWKPVFVAAGKAAVKHYFVEQDRCDRPPLESARISFDYLRRLQVG
jgi:sugar phosphate isomerase/epimerase